MHVQALKKNYFFKASAISQGGSLEVLESKEFGKTWGVEIIIKASVVLIVAKGHIKSALPLPIFHLLRKELKTQEKN